MIKYFCNKCQEELLQTERYRCEVRVRGFSRIAHTLECHYCEDCLAEIIGNENVYAIKKQEMERQARIEERKQQRLTAHPTEKGGEG